MGLADGLRPSGPGTPLVLVPGVRRPPLLSAGQASCTCRPDRRLTLAPHRRLNLVIGGRQGTARPDGGIRTLPEAEGGMLAASFDVRDGAAAVRGEPREFGLAVASRAAICG